MVVSSVLKSGGAILLSCCGRRGGGGGGGLPLLSTCCSPVHCSLVKRDGKDNGNCDGMLTLGLLSVPLSISFLDSKRIAAATTRVFCTSKAYDFSADCSSAVPTTSLAPPASSNEDDNNDLVVLKDAANTLDIRVGRILKAWRHEGADSLYVEEVDIGEAQPRIICSGLVNYLPLDHLQDKKVVVLANLKPRNMRGIRSYGMLMAASDASHDNVELLVPPEGSRPGERIWFGSADEMDNLPAAVTPNQIQKKKIWELVQPHLKTDASCVASLGTHFMRTSAGVVASKSLKNANIS